MATGLALGADLLADSALELTLIRVPRQSTIVARPCQLARGESEQNKVEEDEICTSGGWMK